MSGLNGGGSHDKFQLSIANSSGAIARKPSGGGTLSAGEGSSRNNYQCALTVFFLNTEERKMYGIDKNEIIIFTDNNFELNLKFEQKKKRKNAPWRDRRWKSHPSGGIDSMCQESIVRSRCEKGPFGRGLISSGQHSSYTFLGASSKS